MCSRVHKQLVDTDINTCPTSCRHAQYPCNKHGATEAWGLICLCFGESNMSALFIAGLSYSFTYIHVWVLRVSARLRHPFQVSGWPAKSPHNQNLKLVQSKSWNDLKSYMKIKWANCCWDTSWGHCPKYTSTSWRFVLSPAHHQKAN